MQHRNMARLPLPLLSEAIDPDPLIVPPQTELSEVLNFMSQSSKQGEKVSSYSSCVLIVESDKLVGIFTERDVVKLTAQKVCFSDTRIEQVMTKNVLTLRATENQDISEALEIIHKQHFRHLPIVNAQNALIGLVTSTSIRQVLNFSNLLKLRLVKEVMTEVVISASIDTSVLDLCQQMAEHQVSCVVITIEENQQEIPVGIVTERDIVQFQKLKLDLVNTQAQTIMSSPLFLISPQDSLWKVQNDMKELLVKRLVVSGSQGELQGIVTQTNILKSLDLTEMYSMIQILEEEVKRQTQELEKEITQRQKIQEALFQEKELAQVTLNSITEAVITTNILGEIQALNPIAERLTGWSLSEAKFKPLEQIFRLINESSSHPVINPINEILTGVTFKNSTDLTILISRSGHQYGIDYSISPLRNHHSQITGMVIVFRDVTISRRLAQEISWQATHDTLTGLVNRSEFERQLMNTLAVSQVEHTLCYLDLDQFKIVNDNCGHLAGDQLLRQLTSVMQKDIRPVDILGRLGGDEFGLLLHECSLEQAQTIAEGIRQSIQEFRFFCQGKIFLVGVSIGLVRIELSANQGLDQLLGAADAACYVAKAKGRNCVHVYRQDDPELLQQRQERQWITRINEALEEKRFRLYSQKIVPLDLNNTKNHQEILIRLLDAEDNIIFPNSFIPAAERYDLMPLIDQWVVHHFLEEYTSHFISPPTNTQYSINLSGASISNHKFIAFLKKILEKNASFAHTLCFEITETAAITNLEEALEFIYFLKKIGSKISLDDFGSGTSSLKYLKTIPVDYLKIDGSFVKNIVHEPIDYGIVLSVNYIAHAMQIETIAEFVCDQDILQKLREIGIDYVQGYAIEAPIPLVF